MKTMHTPGPWRVAADAGGVPTDIRCGDKIIGAAFDARMGNDCPPVKKAIANALILASAPDLYEALKQCEMLLSEVLSARDLTETKQARAALARARGEQP